MCFLGKIFETKDVKEELGNQTEFLRGGLVFSTIRYQIRENHAMYLSPLVHVISEWRQKSTSNFTETVRKEQYVKMWDFVPTFLWDYTNNFKEIFTVWSYAV